MGRTRLQWGWRAASISAALIAISGCNDKPAGGAKDGNETAASAPAPSGKHTPNPSSAYPPSKGFDQFLKVDAGRFHSTEQFTVFNPAQMPGSTDSITYQYIYTDDRTAKIRAYNFDVSLKIIKLPSAEQAKAALDRSLAAAIPIANATSVKLPACNGSKRDSDQFIGPSKILETLPNPRGGEVTIFQPGDFNNYDCTRKHNPEESAAWVVDEYYFSAIASAHNMTDAPEGRVKEFVTDYLAALGPR